MNPVDKKHREALYKAISSVKSAEEAQLFFLDLCTPAELTAMAERWKIAQLLAAGELSYRDISAKTGASTTTVARVNRFLKQEPHQGYQVMLGRLGKS